MLWRGCWSGRSPGERQRGPLPKLTSRNIHWRRRLSNGLALGSITLAALIVTVPLFLILGTVVYRGLPALNWSFLTQIPKPVGEIGGGMANAIVGSIMILVIASLIGVPLGVRAGPLLAPDALNTSPTIAPFPP